MSDSQQPQPQLQLVQGEKPRRPRRPPKDPGECRPGDTGALHARLRDFGFEVPPQLRRPLGQNLGRTQKPPFTGHKKDEPGHEPNNQPAAAAANIGEAVMTSETQGQNNLNPQPQAPAAGGGIDFEAFAQKAAAGILGDAVGLVGEAGKVMAAQRAYHEAAAAQIAAADKITWGKVKKVGAVTGVVAVVATGLIFLHAAVNRQGIFTPAAPTPEL